MFYQIFLPPQPKRNVIISNKRGTKGFASQVAKGLKKTP